SVLGVVQRNAFVDDRAVSRCPLQGFAHRFRGPRDIIEPTDFPKFGFEGKMESEKIVLQVIGSKVEKVDLITNSETGARVFDLKKGQVRLFQNRTDIDPRRSRLRVSEPGRSAAGRWMRPRVRAVTIPHQRSSRRRRRWAVAGPP